MLSVKNVSKSNKPNMFNKSIYIFNNFIEYKNTFIKYIVNIAKFYIFIIYNIYIIN